MKKSLLALAVLGAYAGVASAQSSVSLYGTVDLNGRYVKSDGQSRRLSLSQDGINSSQLGFKGTEDLGGGLKAGFLLLSGIAADTGNFGTAGTTNKFFNRRSTVSLMGNFGEIRLGRDYTPTFWTTTIFDAFGTNGVGDSSGIKQLAAADYVRADNSIGYFLPSNLGGVYGQFMAAAAEGTVAGRYLGGRVGFATGPLDVAVAYAQERVNGTAAGAAALSPGTTNGTATAGSGFGRWGSTTGAFGVAGIPTTFANEKYKSWNVGGTYDFGVVKLLGYYNRETIFGLKDQIGSLSLVVPIGQGEVHAGADYSKFTGPYDNKIKKFAVGYVYNLSKRTALYGTGAYQTNDNNSNATIAGATGAASLNGKSKAGEVGIRHFF